MNRMRNKKRMFRWALWTGLLMMASQWFCMPFTTSSDNGPTMGEFFYHGWAMALWTVGLLHPLMEEIAFRLWAVGPRYSHRVDMRITYSVGALLMATSVGVVVHMWWLAVTALPVLLAGIYLLKDTKKQSIFMLLTTSAIFSYAHTTHYSAFEWTDIPVFVGHAGFALVAAYLVFNYNFLWAVLLHVANNGFLILLAFFLLTCFDNHSFETERYSVEVTPYSKQDVLYREHRGDTTWFRGGLNGIAENLVVQQMLTDSIPLEESRTLFHTGDFQPPLHYQLQMVDHVGGKPDYIQVLRAMEREGLVKADTTYEPIWHLYIEDPDRLNSQLDVTSPFKLRDLICHLRIRRLPVVADGGTNLEIPLKIDNDVLYRIETIDSSLAYFERVYGLRAERTPGHRMQVVEFSIP